MAWRQMNNNASAVLFAQTNSTDGLTRFFSKSPAYIVEDGILEFLNGIGKGVEAHAAKLASEIGDFQRLLVTRTSSKLKKIGIPCQHNITSYIGFCLRRGS